MFMCVCELCVYMQMCVRAYVHMYQCPQRPKEEVESPKWSDRQFMSCPKSVLETKPRSFDKSSKYSLPLSQCYLKYFLRISLKFYCYISRSSLLLDWFNIDAVFRSFQVYFGFLFYFGFDFPNAL